MTTPNRDEFDEIRASVENAIYEDAEYHKHMTGIEGNDRPFRAVIKLLAYTEKQRAVVKEMRWRPIELHSGLYSDGDGYLLRVPVRHRDGSSSCEYHIVYASCDGESSLVFKDSNGDCWSAWDWDDADAYIPLAALAARKDTADD